MGCAPFRVLTPSQVVLLASTSFCVSLSFLPCTPASPTPPLSIPSELPSSPVTPYFSPNWVVLSNCHHVLWLCPFRVGVNKHFFQ